MFQTPHRSVSQRKLELSRSSQPLIQQPADTRAIEPLERRLLLHGPDEHDNHNPVAVADASVTQGNLPLTVTFDGTDSSDSDRHGLKYLWSFGDGSPRQRGPVARYTYEVRGEYYARLTVFDGHGGKDTDFVRILAGESVPNPIISFPGEGQLYQAGGRINFFGRATDPEDGPLPERALTWIITLHTKNTTVVLDRIRGTDSGSFTVPSSLPADPNQFIRLTLAAEDSSGIVGRTSVDLVPQRSNLTLNTNFAGLTLKVNKRTIKTPRTFASVVGSTHLLTAPRFQQVGNTVYEFVSWSDGGAASHTITTPFPDTTLTAIYRVSEVITNPFGPRTTLFSTTRIN